MCDIILHTTVQFSSFITPYRQHKNAYYTHTMNAIYTTKTKNAKKKHDSNTIIFIFIRQKRQHSMKRKWLWKNAKKNT